MKELKALSLLFFCVHRFDGTKILAFLVGEIKQQSVVDRILKPAREWAKKAATPCQITLMMKDIDYVTQVKAIERLRLVKNTKDAWCAYLKEMGFRPMEGRANARDAVAIFEKLSVWADTEMDVDLYNLLALYEKFSSTAYTNGTKRHSFVNKESIKELYRTRVLPHYESPLKGLGRIEEEMERNEYDLDLLFLIVSDIIPAYGVNPQDISWEEDLAEKYVYIKDFIAELYADVSDVGGGLFNVEMEKHPYIKNLLCKMDKRIKNGEATRLDLMVFFINVTSNLCVNCDKEVLYEANLQMEKVQFLDIDKGCIWVDAGKELEGCSIYWEFVAIGMDYFLYKYDATTYLYTEYTLVFFVEKENYRFYATHPKSIENLCVNKPVDDNLFIFGEIEVDMDRKGVAQKMMFGRNEEGESPRGETILGAFPPNALKRISRKGHEAWLDSWPMRKKEYRNKYPEYSYDTSLKERMLSLDFIYVEKERIPAESEDEAVRVSSWYRIPRENPEFPLRQIQLEDVILTFRLLGRDYIFFVNASIGMDVTDDESRSRYAVSIHSISGLY